MALSALQLEQRGSRITASFLPSLMAGDDDEINSKWRELIGDPEWSPQDLSDNWPVQFGAHNETFALDWYQRQTGRALTRRGEVVIHPTLPYVACTLDAFRAFDDTVIDCKVSGRFRNLDEALAYYTPQLICQRACVQCRNAALLIVHGGAEPRELEIFIDEDYEATVWQRVAQFWNCVATLTPPVVFPRVTPPEQWRSIDLDADNDDARSNWAQMVREQLDVWKQTKASVELFDKACTEIKSVLPEDCKRLTCSGVVITRNRARAVSIKRA